MNDVNGQAPEPLRKENPASRARESSEFLYRIVHYRWRIFAATILIGAGLGIAGFVFHIGPLVCLWGFVLMFLLCISLLALLVPGSILVKYKCFTENQVAKNPDNDKDLGTLFGAVIGVVMVVATCVTLVVMAYATVGDLRTDLMLSITEKASQVTDVLRGDQDQLKKDLLAAEEKGTGTILAGNDETKRKIDGVEENIMETFVQHKNFLTFFANSQHIFGVPLDKIYDAWGD